QIRCAPGHRQLVQKWIECDKGIRALVARKRDALVCEKLLHHGRIPGSHYKRHIDLARGEFFGGYSPCQRKKFADLPLKPEALEQSERQRPRPAAFGPNRYLPATQTGDPFILDLALAKPPQRLVEERPEGFEPGFASGLNQAALHQTYAHVRMRIEQHGEVL